MFCPKCGTAEQSIESYCRQCGIFLPDFESPAKRETPPETHLQVSTVLTVITAIVSLVFGIFLSTNLLGPEYSSRVVRAAAAFMWCICVWQISILWRTRKLVGQFKGRRLTPDKSSAAAELLNAELRSLKTADLSDHIPNTVTERTTRHLSEKNPR